MLIVEPKRICESTRPNVLGWTAGRNAFHAQIPASSMLRFGSSGADSTFTPSASITSMAPQFDEIARAA